MTTVAGPQVSQVAPATPVGSPTAAAAAADPAPLGLIAFGMTTLVLSVINTGLIGAAAVPIVLGLALPFGGIGQILAGMWAFRRGNTFAATAFTSFGAFWISYYLIITTFAAQVKDPVVLTGVLGLYALAWGIFTAYMFIASLAGAKAVSAVFLLLAATFVALAIGFWGKDAPGAGFTQIGGILGIATAVVAMYVSFADVTNANFKRVILPTF